LKRIATAVKMQKYRITLLRAIEMCAQRTIGTTGADER